MHRLSYPRFDQRGDVGVKTLPQDRATLRNRAPDYFALVFVERGVAGRVDIFARVGVGMKPAADAFDQRPKELPSIVATERAVLVAEHHGRTAFPMSYPRSAAYARACASVSNGRRTGPMLGSQKHRSKRRSGFPSG